MSLFLSTRFFIGHLTLSPFAKAITDFIYLMLFLGRFSLNSTFFDSPARISSMVIITPLSVRYAMHTRNIITLFYVILIIFPGTYKKYWVSYYQLHALFTFLFNYNQIIEISFIHSFIFRSVLHSVQFCILLCTCRMQNISALSSLFALLLLS